MLSELFEGEIVHVRSTPVRRRFVHRIGMIGLDLDEWGTAFRGHACWGHGFPRIWSIRRRDHLGDRSRPLREAVEERIRSLGGSAPGGRIMLLTMPAAFGFAMNPVSFYFALDDSGTPEAVLAEVNNTPWGERQCYLLDPRSSSPMTPAIGKAMHVSPFLPMELSYGWRLNWSSDRLGIVLNCLASDERPVLSVSLELKRIPWSAAALRRWTRRHPLPGWSAWAGIYFQALALKRRGVPFHPHPRSRMPVAALRKET